MNSEGEHLDEKRGGGGSSKTEHQRNSEEEKEEIYSQEGLRVGKHRSPIRLLISTGPVRVLPGKKAEWSGVIQSSRGKT